MQGLDLVSVAKHSLQGSFPHFFLCAPNEPLVKLALSTFLDLDFAFSASTLHRDAKDANNRLNT
ncbi:hypothetical protein DUNSADRAFT_13165 [Dunaliella salina]|uniref:Uncharacterized protein n=1 Tax=Dunaliella salina TaxID=3046 RepID=A0ABQ7G9X8_DUNSA|nr:hypothetical protein DUNSADRAFT_13165 [Dunaliella salina]|eukprot:KAF5831404.1 hypothetical protein DUNSADRAFT_13165 [Dunaliella salina]